MEGGTAMDTLKWETPDFQQISTSAEVTAYTGQA
ncbi:MAG: pyrroloquinoline quinone precursor peptide PqqA [Acidimicrobiaceae bacterium]|jgi:coenzyme PQQ precursor peptide PqqA|nr:pyrroloquinoline quinone precursor peptide PqqA [Acidimicrobiaceae bacterium]MDR0359472.1 pyrroloquinoline quinone precursor peptide PqqA [bacterium]